ncbi:unnamed protein product, partial [Diatraea saccharalis]
MSLDTWKVEKGLCRCCHADGIHTNLAEPQLQKGQQEIYANIMQQCFNINLHPVQGPLCTITYSICDLCAQRLLDAYSFKKQVMQCEERFHNLYNKNMIKLTSSYEVDIKVEISDEDVEDVKPVICVQVDENNDFDFNNEDDDGDDSKEMQLDTEEEQSTTSQPKKPKAKPKAKGQTRKSERSAKAKQDKAEKAKKGDASQWPYVTVEDDDVTHYQCTICKKKYGSRDLFSQHYRYVHLKQRPKLRACYLCPMRVPTFKRSLHLEEVHGVSRPTCNACGKKFSYPNQVIRHQKAFHMDEKMFQCTQCDMKCATRWQLARHSDKHSTKRPYRCEYCDKTFKWKKNLKTHIMIHRDERPHVCDVCKEAFVQQSSLKYHLMKKHTRLR